MTPIPALQPYSPTPADPWDRRKAGHLLRRTGFGPTHAELEAAVRDGFEATVSRVLTGRPETDDFTRTSDFMASERSLPAGAPLPRLTAWWLDRMLKTGHPLREKLALFWHNHFATSHAKVLNARHMLGQYRLIHRHALGSFRDLLVGIGTDPAMMVWLDTTESVRGRPNENYARELMELFSLGIGNYTEADIREAARAFTGYEIVNGSGTFNSRKHDPTPKTVFDRTGPFRGDDVARMCLDNPATSRFVVRKLYRFLVSEAEVPAADVVEGLAARLRDSGYDTGSVVATILRSKLFYSAAAYRARIKPPVEFALGIVRGLEATVGTLPLADALPALGQVPFAPPSVKGWDGGPAWLNAQTLLARNNLALALTSTDDPRFARRSDPAALLARHGKTQDGAAVDFLLGVFLQGDVPAASRDRLLEYLDRAKTVRTPGYWSAADAAGHRVRAVTHLVLTLPEFQLD
ncbi:DUF1800 domain-containing protein [bacterium]|nr:DUF1800 domain-containing protein [bacterium]